MPDRSPIHRLLGLLVAVGLAAGPAHAARRIPAGSTYVALGSSFAAGPGVTNRSAEGPLPCGQSRDNYARQLAQALKLNLEDRSCGGAVTRDVLKGGQFGLPAQLDGLTGDTRLVTITIGGNDVRYMADLSRAVCRAHPDAIAEAYRLRACADPQGFEIEQAFAAAETNLIAIVEQVRRRAPGARLIFVDYITVLPPGPPCPQLLIAEEDVRELRSRAERLERLTAAVARRTHTELLRASRLTRTHHACAPSPWVEGPRPARSTSDWNPAPFHPRLPAMSAIAKALERKLAFGN